VGRGWTGAFLIAVVAVAVHAPALLNGFVLDDHPLVEQSETIRRPLDLGAIWLARFFHESAAAPPYYRPIVTQSFALNFWAGGLSPLGYHAVNVLLHAAAASLLCRLAGRLLPGAWPALLAGLLFAVHPLASEPVDAVYGRTDLLATLFVLAAILAHLRAARAPAAAARLALPALFYLLALLAKESAAPLPVVLLALDALGAVRQGGEWRLVAAAWWDRRRGYLLLAAALGAYLGLRVAALGGVLAGEPVEFVHNPLAGEGVAVRVLTAPLLLVKYLQLWIFPLHLSPDYSFNELPVVHSAADVRFMLCAPPAACFLALGIWLWRRRHLAFAGWACFALFYLLVANLLFPVGALVAERFLYLPMAGLCLLAAGTIGATLEGAPPAGLAQRWGRAAALLVLALLAIAAFRRADDWRDDESVARAAIAAAPRAAVGYNNLGVAVLGGDQPAAQRLPAALGHFLKAIEIYPDYTNALYNAGNVLYQQDEVAAALPFLERSHRLQPDRKGGGYGLGLAYFRLGRDEEALGLLSEATRNWPDEVSFRVDYAAVLESVGRDAEARDELLRALASGAAPPVAQFNLALVEVNLERFADAEPRLRALLEESPDDAAAWVLLGRALAGSGRDDEARSAFERALQLDAGDAEAWYRLGLLQRRRGDPAAATSLERAAALGHPLHEGESRPEVSAPGP